MVFSSSSLSLSLSLRTMTFFSFGLLLAVLTSSVNAFQLPLSSSSSSSSTFLSQKRYRPSSKRDPLSSTTITSSSSSYSSKTTTTTQLGLSDIPQEKNKNNNDKNSNKDKDYINYNNNNDSRMMMTIKSLFDKLVPPPMEDEFTMIGDLSSLFLYSWTSHTFNDMIVQNVLDDTNSKKSVSDVIELLDPDGTIFTTANSQHMISIPVWLDINHPMNSYLIESQSSLVQSIGTIQIHDKLLCHWGPLYTTFGISGIVLCSSWLVAGYMTRSFLFKNTIEETSTSQLLLHTIGTWILSLVFLVIVTYTTNHYFYPLVLQLVAGSHHNDLLYTTSQIPTLFTNDDILFVIDSISVLLAWRYILSSFWGYSRRK